MPDHITIEHAQAVVSRLSKLGENKYSSIAAAANDEEKENLKKTAIGPRMADLEEGRVTLVGAGDGKITRQELVDTFNSYLAKDGGAALTEEQIDYLWSTSIVVIKDPGGTTSTNPSPTNPSPPNSSSATDSSTVPPVAEQNAGDSGSSSETTAQQQVAAGQGIPEGNDSLPISSNSFNKPVTRLNLDADDVQSDGEKNLEKYMNLRYGLDLLESKEDVHVALGREEHYVKEALESLRMGQPTKEFELADYHDNYEEGKTPEHYRAFVLKQAIEDYKKIDPRIAGIAEQARDKEIADMASDEKAALIEVFENYQEKFTQLKYEVSEQKLKDYLTTNYDTLKDLGIDGFPDNIKAINAKNKEELISLAVAATNMLNEKIYERLETITISPEDKKAFLQKYTDIDLSNSEASIEFIKGLTDKELLLFNRWFGTYSFHSRDFIIRELSQHKLSLDKYFRFYTPNLSEDAINSPKIKAALIESATKIDSWAYEKDQAPGQLYRLHYGYLVDFGEGKAKFYKSEQELLGLEARDTFNWFEELAWENKHNRPGLDLGYDPSSSRIYPTSLLRVGENARRLRSQGDRNTLNDILDVIYDSEERAMAEAEAKGTLAQTAWHQQMKNHVARMLLAESSEMFDQRTREFQEYLNDKERGIDGGFFNPIDAARRACNRADAQTEEMLRDVQQKLANSHDTKV